MSVLLHTSVTTHSGDLQQNQRQQQQRGCRLVSVAEFSEYFLAGGTVQQMCKKYSAALAAQLCSVEAATVSRSVSRSHSDTDLCSLGHKDKSLSSTRASCECLLVGGCSSQPQVANGESKEHRHLHKVASESVTSDRRPVARRRVQFADEVGRQLVSVRVIQEPSCMPPLLSIHVNGLSDEDSPQSPESECRFRCQFPQPVSQYIVFRETVQRRCVSLSHVDFDDWTVKGCVAVKNIGFTKRVFLRVTFNEWNSFLDFEAAFSASQEEQDTFVFSFKCPQTLEKSLEFCVCYCASGQEFWDNNCGSNYRIVLSRSAAQPYTRDCKPDFSCVPEFSEFSAWEHFSDAVYY